MACYVSSKLILPISLLISLVNESILSDEVMYSYSLVPHTDALGARDTQTLSTVHRSLNSLLIATYTSKMHTHGQHS